MAGHIDKINLYAQSHAIEVANFVVNLGLAIDHADVRRFDERTDVLQRLFPAINSPDMFQIALGGPPPGNLRPPPPVPVKELTFFSNYGKPEWVGSFGESRVVVSCRKYTKWEEIWPSAKARLDALLQCIDPYKPVHSVDYSVTDTFSAMKSDAVLISPNIFKENNFVAKQILDSTDPRWDFSQGWFDNLDDNDQILVRIDGRSGVQNDLVVASIGNLHSQRFGTGIGVGELLVAKDDEASRADHIFDSFHDKNKDLLKSLLVDDLLVRMRLKEKNDV